MIETSAARQPIALAPSPRDLRPQDLELAAGGVGIAFMNLRDIALSPLPVAAGLLHGRLLAEDPTDGRGIARSFITAWARAAGVDDATLRPYVSLGLLRAACRAFRDPSTHPLAHALLKLGPEVN